MNALNAMALEYTEFKNAILKGNGRFTNLVHNIGEHGNEEGCIDSAEGLQILTVQSPSNASFSSPQSVSHVK